MILWLDPFSGASGDMFLGLLVNLGADPRYIEAQLAHLPIAGWSVLWRREQRRGIEGCRAVVEVVDEHHHRTWRDIDRMLAESSLDAPVRELAQRIFARLAEAEGKVHGVPAEAVHFHEVGALDAIVDIVGAAAGLASLAPQRIVCGPLPLSSGFVATAHGRYPLPAPATLELLRGWPVIDGASNVELLTPTGAAIIAETATSGPCPALLVERIGYGVGSRDLADRPNLLRGLLGRVEASAERDRVAVLESHIDDSPAEWLGELMERLLTAGALDVAFSPLQMKKNRPGVRVTIVCEVPRKEEFARMLLRESSAIGVRISETERLKLRREAGTVATPCGTVAVKLIFEGDELLRVTPEYESCRSLAHASGLPLREIYRLAEVAADAAFNQREEG